MGALPMIARSLAAAAAALLLVPAFALAAGDRVALVIGNSDYEWQSPLSNPVNDADRMAETLTRIGYEVTRHDNLGEREMMRTLADFAEKADQAEVALVYYSGHGMEIGGRNYVIPVDAKLSRERDAEFEAVDLSKMRAAIGGASKLKVVILDACRNNTFLPSTRGGTKGLGRITAEAGEIIAYSTAPGSVAQDGVPGELSPYTRALAEKLEEAPDLDVRFLFTSLGRLTEQYAGVEQRPYTEFAAILPEGSLPLGRAGPPPGEEEYRVAMAGTDFAALRSVVEQFPAHPMRAEAEALLATDAAVGAALAGLDRAQLSAALPLAATHPRRGEIEAALALHDRIDAALAAGSMTGLESAWREAAAAHPRRAEIRPALIRAAASETCSRLVGMGVDCPTAAADRFAAAMLGEAAAPSPTPAPAPAPAPVVVAAAPANDPAPVTRAADPLAPFLADASDASLAKAGSIAMEWRQTALAALGFYRGPVDGAKGPGTRSAIAAWRNSNRLDDAADDLSPREIVALMKQGAPLRPDAEGYLGVMYGLGVGVDLDPAESRRLLESAAGRGFADAANYLKNISKTW